MNRGIYATGTGMLAAEKLLDITANNIANVNTTGYKSDTVAFNDVFQRELGFNNEAFAGIGTLGNGPQFIGQYADFTEGALQVTHNPMDVAIAGENGMFAIQAPQGVRYTRDGSFTLAPDGTLVTSQGYPVLDNTGNTINVGSTGELHIGNDGTLEVGGKKIASLGVYDGTFAKEGASLWTSTNASVEETPNVRQGTLESSNVNPMLAMIDMIKISRAVEMAQKSIQSQDDSSDKLISSLNQG